MKNTLNGVQAYLLTQWIDRNPIPVQTMTQDELALMAGIELKFNVTASNCVMAGKNLGKKVGKQNYVIQSNKTAIQILALSICDIYMQLGELIPEDLKRLTK